MGIINNVQKELIKSGKKSIPDFVKFHGNMLVKIKGINLKGNARKIFDSIIEKIESARNDSSKKVHLDPAFIEKLVKYQAPLELNINNSIECENCGIQLIECRKCGREVSLIKDGNNIIAHCKNCHEVLNIEEFVCSCGETKIIPDLISGIYITPSIYLIDTIKEYYNSLHPKLEYPGIFLIINQELHLLETKLTKYGWIKLSELNYWKNRAKISSCTDFSNKRNNKILNDLKEKCNKNSYHPRISVCDVCAKTNIQSNDIKDLCLLRIFGVPINLIFDGIHHGAEKADIYYDDYIGSQKVKLGIHVKSFSTRKFRKGLGRSDSKIKGLYAQIFYSLYQQKMSLEKFNMFLIAVPNKISNDVTSSISTIVQEMGLGFIAIDRNDWLAILESTFSITTMNIK